MALYKFTLPSGAQTLKYDGKTVAFVQAVSEAAALVLLKAQSTTDNNSVWDNATAEVVGQDLDGAVFSVSVDAPALDVEYTGQSGDTWTDVGEALAALLVEEGMHSTWAVNSTHSGLYGTLVIAKGDANAEAEEVEIVDGGTGYSNDDVLTVGGGTAATAATLTVQVTAGVVTEAVITEAGDYSVFPSNPVSVTGGDGNDDATFNISWSAEQPGAGAVTVTAVDAAGNDISATSVGNIVDEGSATASLTVDILSTAPSEGVEGLY